MKIALFSDIHSNVLALEAVLQDIKTRDIDLIFCLGDLVGYGAYPNQVIEVLRNDHIPTIMGNYDDGVGNDLDDRGCAYNDPRMIELGHHSLMWTREHVTAANKAHLRGLLNRLEFTVYGKKVLLSHGSPRKINEYLYEDRPEESILRLMDQEKADILICGHIHLPYVRNLGGKYLMNTGSAGKPKDGDSRAGYLILNLAETEVETEIVRVSYDVQTMANAILGAGLPPEFAAALTMAR
jgi:putative phosphoesterase